jgi:hypothetical protein
MPNNSFCSLLLLYFALAFAAKEEGEEWCKMKKTMLFIDTNHVLNDSFAFLVRMFF